MIKPSQAIAIALDPLNMSDDKNIWVAAADGDLQRIQVSPPRPSIQLLMFPQELVEQQGTSLFLLGCHPI